MASSKLNGQRPAPRPSLAATHPSNYAPPASKTMMPPPPPPKSAMSNHSSNTEGQSKDKNNAQKSTQPYPTPSPSPKEAVMDYPQVEGTRQQEANLNETLAAPRAPLQAQANMRSRSSHDESKAPWEQHTDPTVILPKSSHHSRITDLNIAYRIGCSSLMVAEPHCLEGRHEHRARQRDLAHFHA